MTMTSRGISGVYVQIGRPLDLYRQPANTFVASFLGSPPINLIDDRNGQAITLGIRPEDLHVATSADPPGLTFSSKVEVIEQLGSEILLDVRVGEESMVAAVDPTIRAKVAETLQLAVNPERLHFFDAKTEAAV